MAKIDIVRLPEPQKNTHYNNKMKLLVQSESIIFQINKESFFEELKNEIDRKEWFSDNIINAFIKYTYSRCVTTVVSIWI